MLIDRPGHRNVLAERGELMSRPATSIPAELTLADAQHYFARYRYTAFPAVDPARRAVGMPTVGHLRRTLRARWMSSRPANAPTATPRC
jgi:CBS-domain-containing membrane protein